MFTSLHSSEPKSSARASAPQGKAAPFFQAKLTVNTPGDAHEQEADAVADKVMRMREGDAPIVQRMPLTPVSGVMRACAECEKEKMQRKETGGGDAGGKAAPSVVSDVLSSSSGQPMEGGTRQFMESRFGQDFSQVRIHTDSRAAESASAIQARAYTSGRDVVFGAGEYQPGSEGGRRLLAHELVHVGQQGGRIMGNNSVPSIQRVAPLAIAGLAVGDLATILGSVTAVAATVGIAMQPVNNKSGKAPIMKLKFDGNYLMSAKSKAHLENITRAIFFSQIEKLNSGNLKDNPDDLRQTAIGNTQQLVISSLDRNAQVHSHVEVANGDGGKEKETPWGSVLIKLVGGKIYPGSFDKGIYPSAQNHGIEMPVEPVQYIKSCLVDYEFETDIDPVSDDDVYVRGQDLEFIEDETGNVQIICTVAFDWDSSTTYYDWREGNAIAPGVPIPAGKWVGVKDPDD